jgi:anti-sigma regulatory factor (Ser/Thr protein kinase)
VNTTLRNRFEVALPFDEFRVWGQQMRPLLEQAGVQTDCLAVLEYVCTEMLNNVLDHSGASMLSAAFDWSPASVALRFSDNGRGIFKVVRQAYALDSEQDAALLLLKGKVTSDPKRHTGEGLFFSSRACQWFCAQSGSIGLSLTAPSGWLFESPNEQVTGTRIGARVSRDQPPDLKRLFDEFCPQPDLQFSRTVVQVGLQRHADGELVSRSQGKRLVLGLEKFSAVTFDFSSVASMQQGFADEVFRVWRNAHPNIRLQVRNVEQAVSQMLRHVGFVDAG